MKNFNIEVKVGGETVFQQMFYDKDISVDVTQKVNCDWKSDISVTINNSLASEEGLLISGYGGYNGNLNKVINDSIEDGTFNDELVMS